MLIDRSHRAWALFSLISLTAATIGWTVSLKYSPAGASGGSFPGLLFGILGTAMMLFAGLLAGRRPLRHLPLGSARFWMKGHLWLGTLCIPFILFHSGFAWGGVLEQLLWYCLAFVALSGFFGLAVQQFLPGLLWKSVPLETFEPQSPWLCDRLTLVNDTKLSALCERQLDAPSPHLQEPAKRTVAAYQKLMDGPGARNEKNARKLLLLQEVSPPAVRDFFWAMAKYCRTELKAIGFDGDFPELLGRLYSALRPPTVPSDPEPPAAQPVQSADTPPAAPTESAAPAVTKVSPLDAMRQKAALKAAAASGAVGGAAPLETSAEASSEPSSAVSSVAPAAAPVKLSPLEQMRQKAAAASGAGGGGAASETPAAASPKPAPAAAAAAAAASTPSASAVKPPVAVKSPAGKPPTPPVKPPGDGSAGGRQPPTESAPPISLSPDEKGVLWDFYVNQVRPYLMEHGSGGVVRRSRFATEMGAQRVFREQKALLPKSLHAVLDDLYGSVEVRRQLEQQRRLLRWMHWWLMLHVPVSILLLVFLAAHVLMALRVVPLQF